MAFVGMSLKVELPSEVLAAGLADKLLLLGVGNKK